MKSVKRKLRRRSFLAGLLVGVSATSFVVFVVGLIERLVALERAMTLIMTALSGGR